LIFGISVLKSLDFTSEIIGSLSLSPYKIKHFHKNSTNKHRLAIRNTSTQNLTDL